MHARAQIEETIVRLVPGGEGKLSHLSDDDLLTSTRRLVGASNKLFAELLLHLAEVETRGIHRARACASLYTYCIYEPRMSEDAAARRSSAARLVRRFPLLLHAIARGELHLTGLLMLGPHLTLENHVEVLGRAKFRTKKELAKLVRELSPLPLVPDVMVPLRPEPPRALRAPTWEEWVTSLCPPVRELKPGETPCDWAGITAPQQYQMQFSTTEEQVRLVERAKALLARSSPGISLGELHLQAMQLLVAALEKEKLAATKRPHKTKPSMLEEQTPGETPHEGGGADKPETPPRQRGAEPRSVPTPAPRQRTRHVPAEVKREVFARDGGRCSYVDGRGERCRERRYLELHHLEPFARGGDHVTSNLALRCAAHNALAAEEDFGRNVVERKRHAARHGSISALARTQEPAPIDEPRARRSIRQAPAQGHEACFNHV